MRDFSMHQLTAAIMFTVLLMGAIGFFIVFPVVCINWTWNTVVSHYTILPQIHLWQACLLYTAFACFLYLMGWVRIEFKTETID